MNTDLMKPRIKCIAPYPHMELDQVSIGDVFTIHNANEIIAQQQLDFYKSFPHLFKPLEWWEEIEISDMPEYLKLIIDNKTQYVHRVEKWVGFNHGQPLYEYKNKVGYQSSFSAAYSEPATEQEYNDYINKSK